MEHHKLHPGFEALTDGLCPRYPHVAGERDDYATSVAAGKLGHVGYWLIGHSSYVGLQWQKYQTPIPSNMLTRLIRIDFPCQQAAAAYATFQAAAQHQALKVAIDFDTA